jgi:16S rRNA (guanine527-N7)-methyltransferase
MTAPHPRELPLGSLPEGCGAEAVRSLERAADLDLLGTVPLGEQIDHSLGFVGAVEWALGHLPRSFLDLGSGGGLPGLVLAACWPEADGVLLDASERRTAFLLGEVEGWSGERRLRVLRRRAEAAAHDEALRGCIEAVTSRSFGPPAVTLECGLPFVATGGVLVVSEPPDLPSGGRWDAEAVAMLGGTVGDRVVVGGRATFQVLHKSEPTPERFPRRTGVPGKRPLF